MNFGPNFKYPPKDLDEQNIKWKPMSERYLEIEAEVCFCIIKTFILLTNLCLCFFFF